LLPLWLDLLDEMSVAILVRDHEVRLASV